MKFHIIDESGNQTEVKADLREQISALKEQEIPFIRISGLNRISINIKELYEALCCSPYLPVIILDGSKDLDYYKKNIPILSITSKTSPIFIKQLPDKYKICPNPLRWFKEIHEHLCATWHNSGIKRTPPELVTFVNQVHEIMKWSQYELTAKRLEIGHADEAGKLLIQNYAELARHSFEHESLSEVKKAREKNNISGNHETLILWIENNPIAPLKQISPC